MCFPALSTQTLLLPPAGAKLSHMARHQTLPGKRVTKNEFCEVFGVALTTAEAWLRAGMPHEFETGVKGKPEYRILTGPARRWLIEHEVQKALIKAGAEVGSDGTVSRTLDDARKRKTEAEADMAEIELAKKSGEAILLGDAMAQWAQLISNCRAKLLSAPSKMAPVVAVEEDVAKCRRIIEDTILEALSELDHYDPKKTIQDFEEGDEGA